MEQIAQDMQKSATKIMATESILVTRTCRPLKDEGEKTLLDMFCSLLKLKRCADLGADLDVGVIVAKSYISQRWRCTPLVCRIFPVVIMLAVVPHLYNILNR